MGGSKPSEVMLAPAPSLEAPGKPPGDARNRRNSRHDPVGMAVVVVTVIVVARIIVMIVAYLRNVRFSD